MRPLFALAITTFLIGGTFAYLRFADSVHRDALDYQVVFAEETYALEIRKSFDAVSDPIFGTESLTVLFKGKPVFSSDEEIPADQVIRIEPLEGVEVGENELFVTSTRKLGNAALAVIQLSVTRDDFPVAEKTIVSAPGLDSVSGTMVFDTRRMESETHNH